MRITLLVLVLASQLAAADLSVNVSGQSGSAFATQLQTADVQVARFVVQASGGDVTVDAVDIHFTNAAGANTAFTGIRLFYDADGNGIFDTSEEVDVAQTPNGVDDFVTFVDSFTVFSGQIRELQLRATVSNNTAAYGQAFQFRVDGAASLLLANGGDTVSGNLPAQANAITIRHSENRLHPGTGNPSQPRDAFFNNTNKAAMHFVIESLNPTPPGQLAGVDLTALQVSVTLGTAEQTDAVTRLTLWQDDGDALFEPNSGEVLIQERMPSDAGKWGISGSVIIAVFDGTAVQQLQAIPAGQARAFWVGIDFGSGLEAVCEVSINAAGVLGAEGIAADFFIANPPLISGNVINLKRRPPPPESTEAQGEGGCAAAASGQTWFWLALLIAPIALRISVRRRRWHSWPRTGGCHAKPECHGAPRARHAD